MDVRMPDGTVVQNVPDDISKADLLSRYQSYQQKAAPDSSEPQVPGLSEGLAALSGVPRQLGLTVRAGAQGLGAIPNAIGDALGMGSSAAYGRLLDKVLPSPQNATERFANAVASGMAQPGLSAAALPQLGARLGTQVLSAGAGAGSSQLAQEAGYGPMGQFGAGLAGGILAPAAVAATGAGLRAAARIPGSLIAPLTKSGQENMAAKGFQGSATNLAAARDALGVTPELSPDAAKLRASLGYPPAQPPQSFELVPGSVPTTAEIANDSGLSSLYKTLRNQNTAPFSDAERSRDAARQAFLSDQFGGPSDVISAKAARDAVTGPMRDSAFANAGPVNTAPIVQAGTNALEAGAKYRGSGPMLQKFVNDISQINDPQVLYNGPRKAISDAIAGKVSQDSPLASFTKSELMNLRGAIDDQIEGVAPGFKAYLQKHSDLSRPIDAQQLGQKIVQSATNNSTDALSAAKFANQVSANGPDIARAGPQASDALARVNMDLKRSIGPQNAMRIPGSDTIQNAMNAGMVARMLGRLPGGTIAGTGAKIADWLYTLPRERVQQMMVNGQLDPAIGAQLLGKRLPQNPDLLAGLLSARKPILTGGLLGTISNQ